MPDGAAPFPERRKQPPWLSMSANSGWAVPAGNRIIQRGYKRIDPSGKNTRSEIRGLSILAGKPLEYLDNPVIIMRRSKGALLSLLGKKRGV